jgi:predicted secreted hydrolase
VTVRAVLAILLAVGLGSAGFYLLWPHKQEEEVNPGFQLRDVLGGQDATGYSLALGPRVFTFPLDHGPHPDFRSEWWYFTGNLATQQGRRFGFQFTLFRFALRPDDVDRASEWGTRQAYMAHFALTDAADGNFYAFQRFARGAAGLAGAQASPFRIWLEDWRVEGAGHPFPLLLQAQEGSIGVTIHLNPLKQHILQGYQGLSQKSAEPGNASYYYSYPRLAAKGEVRLGSDTYPATGTAWLDREWSTSALSDDQVGWDWFSLQLTDGHELMVYRLRRANGATDPFSAGTWIHPNGEAMRLGADDVRIEPLGEWISPRSGVRYPSGWRLSVPSREMILRVLPVQPNQELNLAVRYWEGAVDVAGSVSDQAVEGVGYVELTGYGQAAP